jgi:uncharacterized membrane protein
MEQTPIVPEKSSTGLDVNLAAALTYLLGFITGIVFLVIEKESRFVRFHAMQSTIVFVFLFVLSVVLDIIPFIGWALNLLILLLGLVLWIVLMLKAYQGEKFKLPVAGDMAEQKS